MRVCRCQDSVGPWEGCCTRDRQTQWSREKAAALSTPQRQYEESVICSEIGVTAIYWIKMPRNYSFSLWILGIPVRTVKSILALDIYLQSTGRQEINADTRQSERLNTLFWVRKSGTVNISTEKGSKGRYETRYQISKSFLRYGRVGAKNSFQINCPPPISYSRCSRRSTFSDF